MFMRIVTRHAVAFFLAAGSGAGSVIAADALGLMGLASYGVFLAALSFVAFTAVPLTAGLGPRGGSKRRASPGRASG